MKRVVPMGSLALCALLVALGCIPPHRGEVGAAPPGHAPQDRPAGGAQEDPEVPRSPWSRSAVTRGYKQIEFVAGDYEEEYEEPTGRWTVPGPLARCDYDPCAHMQVPCLELQRAAPCLCPGESGKEEAPEQPWLSEVSGVGQDSADVRWCAPASAVDAYRLVYRPLGAAGANGSSSSSSPPLSGRARLFALRGLSPGTPYRVCILASNQAGDSRLGPGDWGAQGEVPPGYGPCATFTTAASSASALHLALAVLLPLLLLLLGLALALTLLRCLARRRHRAANPEPSIGLQNPSYEEDKISKLQS